MIEVLVSLVILSLVVTASLKLAALSERGLSQVREREALIDEAYRLKTEIALDPLNRFGTSGDVEWNVEEMEDSMWMEQLSAMRGLMLSGQEQVPVDLNALANDVQRWRELEVTKNGKSLTLFLPYSEEAAAALSDDGALSLDVAGN
jgi:hypothetical protein